MYDTMDDFLIKRLNNLKGKLYNIMTAVVFTGNVNQQTVMDLLNNDNGCCDLFIDFLIDKKIEIDKHYKTIEYRPLHGMKSNFTITLNNSFPSGHGGLLYLTKNQLWEFYNMYCEKIDENYILKASWRYALACPNDDDKTTRFFLLFNYYD